MSTQTAGSTTAAQGCCGSQSGCGSQGHSHSQDHEHGHAHDHSPLVQPELPKHYVYDPEATDAAIRLTEKAAVELKRYMSEKNISSDAFCLRVAVQGGGCSGYQEYLGFDQISNCNEEVDTLSDQFGIRVAMNKKFLMFLQGATIDYHDGIDRRGFKFDNPNSKGSCGCGKSFSV